MFASWSRALISFSSCFSLSLDFWYQSVSLCFLLSVFCVSSLLCSNFVKFGIPFSLVSLSDVFLFCPVARLPFQNSRASDSSPGFDHLESPPQCLMPWTGLPFWLSAWSWPCAALDSSDTVCVCPVFDQVCPLTTE